MTDDRLRDALRPRRPDQAPSFDAVLRRRPPPRRLRPAAAAVLAALILAPVAGLFWAPGAGPAPAPRPTAPPQPEIAAPDSFAIELPRYSRALERPFRRTLLPTLPRFPKPKPPKRDT